MPLSEQIAHRRMENKLYVNIPKTRWEIILMLDASTLFWRLCLHSDT